MKTKVNTKYEYVNGEGDEVICDRCEQEVTEWFANYYHEVCDECYHNYYAKEAN